MNRDANDPPSASPSAVNLAKMNTSQRHSHHHAPSDALPDPDTAPLLGTASAYKAQPTDVPLRTLAWNNLVKGGWPLALAQVGLLVFVVDVYVVVLRPGPMGMFCNPSCRRRII